MRCCYCTIFSLSLQCVVLHSTPTTLCCGYLLCSQRVLCVAHSMCQHVHGQRSGEHVRTYNKKLHDVQQNMAKKYTQTWHMSSTYLVHATIHAAETKYKNKNSQHNTNNTSCCCEQPHVAVRHLDISACNTRPTPHPCATPSPRGLSRPNSVFVRMVYAC